MEDPPAAGRTTLVPLTLTSRVSAVPDPAPAMMRLLLGTVMCAVGEVVPGRSADRVPARPGFRTDRRSRSPG